MNKNKAFSLKLFISSQNNTKASYHNPDFNDDIFHLLHVCVPLDCFVFLAIVISIWLKWFKESSNI